MLVSKKTIIYLLLLCIYTRNIYAQQANGFKTYRVQHKPFHFDQYTTKKYTLYIEKDADSIARTVIENTAGILKELEDSLQLQASKRLNIIIYNAETNRAQSNIGHQFEENNPGGKFQFTGNRIVIPFKGNKKQLLSDIKYELSRHILYKTLYGNSTEEILRQLGKSDYPYWFVEGAISYFAEGLTVEEDNLLKHYLLSGYAKTFNDCIQWNAKITGKAFLYYLESKYGKMTLPALLFQLASKKELNKAIQLNYKKPLPYLMKSTLAFFAGRYISDNTTQDSIPFAKIVYYAKNKKEGRHILNNTLHITSEGKSLIYLVAAEEKYTVIWEQIAVAQNKKSQKKVLYTFNKESHTETAPLLFLSDKRNPHLCLILNAEGRLVLHEWVLSEKGNLSNPVKRELKGLDGVVDACYGFQNNKIILSAFKDGQTDLYEYTIPTGVTEQITHDGYDESYLCLFSYNNKKGLIFTSNNLSDTVTGSHKAVTHKSIKDRLHYIEYEQIQHLKKANTIEQIRSYTFPQDCQTRKIKSAETGKIYFLSDEKGINNLHSLALAETGFENEITHTNLEYNASEFAVLPKSVLLGFQMNDSVLISETETGEENKMTKPTILVAEKNEKEEIVKKIQQEDTLQKTEESAFSFFKADKEEKEVYRKEQLNDRKFTDSLLSPYHLQLSSEYVVAQLDNSLLINAYQPYAMNQGLFRQPPLGGMIKYAFTDLFEDHRVNIGVRIPSTARGSDFFINYVNNKNRLDWGFTYLRHTEKFTFSPEPQWFTSAGYFFPPYIKQKTHYTELQTTYPFSKKSAVKLVLALRYDRQVFLSTDTTSLRFPDTSQLWSSAKLEYQLNKTTEPVQYITKGYRAKVFFEYQYQLRHLNIGFIHTGFDIRHYQSLYKNIILANKLSGAISAGETNGMMYVLGGTSNWLAPRTDTSVHFLPKDNYSFITYANNLRGYAQNIRTGNTYMLLNTEIRIPLMNTFFNQYTSFNPLNNLQFVPFIDVGNAWTPSINKNAPQWPAGYGFGFRTTLLSYFVRADLAWQNISQPNQKRPMIVIGMGREY